MGYHHCPIEPSDWSDGPDDEGEPCPDCVDGVVNREAMRIDGIDYPAIVDQRCETCEGNGVIYPEPYEPYDPDYFDCEGY